MTSITSNWLKHGSTVSVALFVMLPQGLPTMTE